MKRPPLWNIILAVVFALSFIVWIAYYEVKFHYLEEYNGVVTKKLQIPPKNMPELVIKGADEIFPCGKWSDIDFNSVKIGDSIVKRKYESNAYYYKKLGNGKYSVTKLEYWTSQ
ncbi:MAG: hypothetical protein EOO43_18745 [Flavobacterium sp.]|nr:MAG: hypothetical protein EOO43_18745 [Flavobacterium sp.]